MKYAEFNQHAKHILGCVENILIKKQAEYAEGGEEGNRLYNFLQPTSLLNTNPARVCFLYDTKHICSIAKITEDIDKGVLPTKEIVEEKLQDYIAYGVLLYAQLMEIVDNPSTKICPKTHQNRPEGASEVGDDSDTVSTKNEENFSENEDSLNFYNTPKSNPHHKSRPLDTSDSITKTPRPNVLDDLNLRTNL